MRKADAALCKMRCLLPDLICIFPLTTTAEHSNVLLPQNHSMLEICYLDSRSAPGAEARSKPCLHDIEEVGSHYHSWAQHDNSV